MTSYSFEESEELTKIFEEWLENNNIYPIDLVWAMNSIISKFSDKMDNESKHIAVSNFNQMIDAIKKSEGYKPLECASDYLDTAEGRNQYCIDSLLDVLNLNLRLTTNDFSLNEITELEQMWNAHETIIVAFLSDNDNNYITELLGKYKDRLYFVHNGVHIGSSREEDVESIQSRISTKLRLFNEKVGSSKFLSWSVKKP